MNPFSIVNTDAIVPKTLAKLIEIAPFHCQSAILDSFSGGSGSVALESLDVSGLSKFTNLTNVSLTATSSGSIVISGGVSIAADLYIAGAIFAQTISLASQPLTCTMSGIWASPVSFDCSIQKIGKYTFLNLPSSTATSNASGTSFSINWPTALQYPPLYSNSFSPLAVQTGAATVVGFLIVSSNPSATVASVTISGTTFSNPGLCGFASQTIQWYSG